MVPNQILKQRYRILKELGRGGFGAVYKAEDIDLVRLVALKEMLQQNASQQDIDNFKNEARMLAQLRHSHLPVIHEYFSEAGYWYLVMEFIEGETLQDYLDKQGGKLPLKDVFDIGIQLCTVLDYLHNRQPQIIFRDLKPLNIMRTSTGHLYLIDFGIARHFKPGQAKDTFALGSPGYAAPEQYGHSQTTPRSDIYSLGAVLHQLITGNNPSFKPFKFTPLAGLPIPADLGTLIMQMLEMDEDKRPTSAKDVKTELQRIAARQQNAPQQIQFQQSSAPTGTTIQIYKGHSKSVGSLAWSPDGKYIASGSCDKTVQVWFAATGRLITQYVRHSDCVSSISWSPDGKYIVSLAYSDKTAPVWDAATGRLIIEYKGHAEAVYNVSWSPDGKYIVSAGISSTYGYVDVHVWNASTGKKKIKKERIASYTDNVYFSWSPDGAYIASGAGDFSNSPMQVWDATTGRLITEYTTHYDSLLNCVAWSPNGKHIATAGFDKTVQVWDALTGRLITEYTGHTDVVYNVSWSPDGKYIVSAGSFDKTVQVWDALTGSLITKYTGHSDCPVSVAWSPDGKYIASAGGSSNYNDATVHVWIAPK